jgi:outer membrane protein assembly factor BamE (lipoprotein component of BamABCDE complex)
MSFFKNHIIYISIIFLILTGCQLKEPSNKHGILFLENRSNQLKISKNNKNDVLKLIGKPHVKSINDENSWYYIERVLTKGDFHKLGQNVVKVNNVLVLSFDKYGILNKKDFYNKKDIKKINFSDKVTDNDLSKTSFIEAFLSSIRTKMYSNTK